MEGAPYPGPLGNRLGASPVTFAASKQLENQVNLLWERLSRLVGALARPKNYDADSHQIALVEFDVALTPFNRKKQMCGVQYRLSCEKDGEPPVVLDLFPNASAVNIANTKYRENRIGLAAVLSWFTVGLNAAYNRDHLQVSQSLGQAAYVTGFGTGKDSFGWTFGRNLGDDMVTPGQRTVFALIAWPKGCDARVAAEKAAWFKDGSDGWYNEPNLAEAHAYPLKADSPNADSPAKTKAIAYSPVEYDQSGKSSVSLSITSDKPIDPQQTVTINGVLIQRQFDTFGRAISGTGTASVTGLLVAVPIPTPGIPPAKRRSYSRSIRRCSDAAFPIL